MENPNYDHLNKLSIINPQSSSHIHEKKRSSIKIQFDENKIILK